MCCNNNIQESNVPHCIGLSIKPSSARSTQYGNWAEVVLLLAAFGTVPMGYAPD